MFFIIMTVVALILALQAYAAARPQSTLGHWMVVWCNWGPSPIWRVFIAGAMVATASAFDHQVIANVLFYVLLPITVADVLLCGHYRRTNI